MKAEERKHLQRNELETRLKSAWSGMNSTSKTSNRVWTAILAVFTLIILYALYARYRTSSQSDLWVRLDIAPDVPALEKIVKEFGRTTQGEIARFHIARIKSAEGMLQIGKPGNGDERVAAANALEESRTVYGELTNVTSLPSEMTAEAFVQLGRLEEILASVPTANDPAKMRGSLDAAKNYYEQLIAKFPNCFFATEATKRVEDIKAHKADIESLNKTLAEIHGKAPVLPTAPLNVTPATDPTPTPAK